MCVPDLMLVSGMLEYMQIIISDAVEVFLCSLSKKELAKVIRTIELLEEFGNTLNMPHSRHMADGLLELRVRGVREVRIFYCFHAGSAILLTACIKKTQKTVDKELRKARAARDGLR